MMAPRDRNASTLPLTSSTSFLSTVILISFNQRYSNSASAASGSSPRRTQRSSAGQAGPSFPPAFGFQYCSGSTSRCFQFAALPFSLSTSLPIASRCQAATGDNSIASFDRSASSFPLPPATVCVPLSFNRSSAALYSLQPLFILPPFPFHCFPALLNLSPFKFFLQPGSDFSAILPLPADMLRPINIFQCLSARRSRVQLNTSFAPPLMRSSAGLSVIIPFYFPFPVFQ